MSEILKCPEQFVFGLDIGTRSIVGTIGYMNSAGFHVVAMEVKEHDTRAMLDGQVHDIEVVSQEIIEVKNKLEAAIQKPLKNVCIAAAGRVLRTITVSHEMEHDDDVRINSEDIYNLEIAAVEKAHRQIIEQENNVNFYCVGYTTVKYYLNDYEMSNLEGHRGAKIGVDLLATFLPDEVVDGLYSSVEAAGLEVANLTLEPIAAMSVAIPQQYRLLNIALVDVGAGTSDICITKDGSVIAYGMIPAAGDELSEIIAKKYLVDFNQAEKIKQATGGKKVISFKDIMGTKITIKPQEVIELTRPITDKITEEVAQKIIELNGGKPVSAVFIVGGGGKIPGFAQSLAQYLELPKERVALRGKEVLENVEFAVTNVKKDSLYVTPVGICVNYYSQKNSFIYVTVNSERIKLYDNNNLSVIDAIMQVGFPNENLFPKRGAEITYTLNGISRMVRGESGEPAIIHKNGKEANMNTPIEKNDFIDIKESTAGKPARLTIDELSELKGNISFIVNEREIECPRFPYVNGEIKRSSYEICDGDSIVMENYYTLEQLFEFMDMKLEEYEVTVNNEEADADTRVYENFSVKYEAIETEPEKSTENTMAGKKEEPKIINAKSITVSINGRATVLSGKESYKFVDIFDFYNFDLTNPPEGKVLSTKVNDRQAEFMGALDDGDEIELLWK